MDSCREHPSEARIEVEGQLEGTSNHLGSDVAAIPWDEAMIGEGVDTWTRSSAISGQWGLPLGEVHGGDQLRVGLGADGHDAHSHGEKQFLQ